MAEFDGEPGSASSKEGTEGLAPAAANPEESPSTATPISVKICESLANGVPKNGIKPPYKAGSKINQLADMLAKRSQKTVDAVDVDVNKTDAVTLNDDSLPPPALNSPEDSTKTVKTRSSLRCKKEVDAIPTDYVAKRVKTKKQLKISKLVETSTQTCELVVVKEEEEPPPLSEIPIYICLFCHLTFNEKTDCLNHEATHSLKRKTKFIKCQFCSKKLPNLEEFKSHGVKHHGPNFHLCMECDLRFLDHHSLLLHTKADHCVFEPFDAERTPMNKKIKTGLDIDVNCELSKKPSISPRTKLSPKTDEQLYEAEMLFYSHLSGNIQENLSKHLDGKINETGIEPVETSNSVLAVVSSNSCPTVTPVARAPSPYQTRSKTPNPLPTTAKKFKKLPNWQQKFWEKYNFPTNYRFQHKFWDKNYISSEQSPLYLKDLSCLDIKTQLTMRANVKKLEQEPQGVNEDDERLRDTFPYFLNLVPEASPPVAEIITPPKLELIKVPKKKIARKARDAIPPPQVVTRRQREMGNSRQRKGSLDMTLDKKMILRRQTSLEQLDVSNSHTDDDSACTGSKDTTLVVEPSLISGEWVRPRSYLCSTCCAKFSNLSELEDHKWSMHPNVWCTHYEFEDAKLEKMLQIGGDDQPGASITLPDIYRRFLHTQGSLQVAETIPPSFPQSCKKCQKVSVNQPELHKHMLECGGDKGWFLAMSSSPATLKRRWRPYGSRRRRQIAQGVKRNNIPQTPPLRSSYCTPKVRTKPGDVETIQKMLANLPEKRTRRAINFDEINTRSQSTIHSNRLLRKRFNASFGSNFLRRKALTVQKVKRDSKSASEASSKAGSEASLDTTPASSPRRRFRLKEVTVDVTPITLPVDELTIAPAKKKKRKPSKKKSKKEIARNGMLIKKIKNKLKTSKKLLEVRKKRTRSSGRIKKQVKTEEDAFTVEETVTPIAKLSRKKVLVSPEMPQLDPEEPVKTRKTKTSSTDLPILQPFESEEDVRFVVKKLKKQTMLKLVKEKKPETGSDSEPLIALKRRRQRRARPKKKLPVIEPDQQDQTISTNLERLISDQLVKRKKEKKEEPKRLCLTVTLKEATLKVLDKPTTPTGPNKWTVSIPADSAINFNPEAKNEPNLGLPKNLDSPQQEVVQTVTIVEATSTADDVPEQAEQPEQPSSTSEPIIVEADSSVEVEEESKTEMVVSSTEPAKPKKRRKKLTVEFESKDEVPSSTLVVPEELERRTRRKSKEVPITNEFIIDDPLLLVDELWSDLDSDSDSRQRKRKPKKKVQKPDYKQVDLEELLRNFGEKKEKQPEKREYTGLSSRQKLERTVAQDKSFVRLSLRLFMFNRKDSVNGREGMKLVHVKKILRETMKQPVEQTVLSSEVVENPEQVIVCRSAKPKIKKPEPVRLKVSLPLELIGDLSLLNNNHLQAEPPKPECCLGPDDADAKSEKHKRVEVIDKIFYCELCKTYYYCPSQLKSHKMSNRHKMKEAEMFENHLPIAEAVETLNPSETDILGDDTSDMPVLEGPFIETPRPDPQPPPAVFSFSQENLKDIQKAIGCTDDEMLILTLLGENATPEPDLLDLSNCTTKRDSEKPVDPPSKTNGVLKVDLKQRMTSALASLVNKAVNNLLKSETASKPVDTFLSKLSGLSTRKKSALGDIESPLAETSKVRYKYQCTICGNRFEKETTRDYHIIRTHRVGKRNKQAYKPDVDDLTSSPTDWNESWYDCDDFQPTSQFWCSDCGINFVSPKQVLDHQRAEHTSDASRLAPEEDDPNPMSQKRPSTLDPDQERLLAKQALQKLGSRRVSKRPRKNSFPDSIKFSKNESHTDDGSKTVLFNGEEPKTMDVYDFNEFDSEPEPVVFAPIRKKTRETDEDSEDNLPLAAVKPGKSDTSDEDKKESFKISLENRLLKLDGIPLKKSSPSCSEDDTLPLPTRPELEVNESDDQLNGNIIFQRNDSESSCASFNINPSFSDSETVSEEENGRRRQKKIVPLLSATLTNVTRKSESPKLNKKEIVKKIWSRQKLKSLEQPEERRNDEEDDDDESVDDFKITEFSNEVVIKCGPKPQTVNRRRSLNETAKNAIVRRIWSGKAFQTKAALKTYDSDVIPLIDEPDPQPAKRRGRPASMSAVKKKRASSNEDDLDSLLEEIEQENVEKAIRLEFLHLRRSERPADAAAEPAGLFAEIQANDVKEEKKKRKIRKNLMMKRKQDFIDFRDRHHRRHRHRHHHHKHKHKKSRHHKRVVVKHRKHKPEVTDDDYRVAQPLQALEPFQCETKFNCSEPDKV